VGVVGLGVMGSAMSKNLIAAGFDVTGYDIDAARTQEFVAAGGTAASSPRAVAEAVDVLITSLPSTAALEDVVSGAQGLVRAAAPNLIVLEMSTFPLDAKFMIRDRLADVGITVLDAPPSGTGAQARVKDLVIYVSGDEKASEKVKDVLAGFSRAHFYTGEYGNGSKFKYIANLLVTIHNLSTAEAMLLGKRAGLDVGQVLEVIGGGAGTSRMFQVRGPLMVAGNYDEPTMRVDTFDKDIDIIRRFAHDVRSPTPLFSAATQFYEAATAQGRAGQDTACVFAVLEQLTKPKS
jgi:3-hydroxyisobutyrate dehydrogenase-like beta-hydroxyacid dehydrogenase